MRIRESRIETVTVAEAAALGIQTYKLAGQGEVGKSDRIFFRKGRCAFVELKAPGKTPEPVQLRKIERHNAEGTPAAWFDNPFQAIQFLKKHLL